MNSSLSELDLQPGVPTQQAVPPNQDGPSRNRLKLRMVIAVAVVILVAAIGLVMVRRSPKPAGPWRSQSNVAPSRRLRLKGTTEAVHMRSILAPTLAGQFVATLTITKLATSGSTVKQGDLLVEFDRQSQMREFIDKQADYTKLQNQVIQEQAKESATRAKDETEIKQAE